MLTLIIEDNPHCKPTCTAHCVPAFLAGEIDADTMFYAIGWEPPRYPVPARWTDTGLTMLEMLWLHHDAPVEWVFEVINTD